jgi:SAM-dependent methyltransferase
MNAPTDLTALKSRQQTAWASGDYAVIGTTLQLVGELLAEACDLRCDERVLDVAAGNGNATLAAARRGCAVTSTDYVSARLERSAERAAAERLDVKFQVADAEALPFADASFDAVLSTFGVMFSPDQAKAASELARVCRPGGRIGLANWTPAGFVGQLFKTLGRRGASVFAVQRTCRRHRRDARLFNFRYRSAAHFIEVFRTWYGPVHKAFAALPADKALVLEHDLTDLLNSLNKAGANSLVVPSEHLEVVITRRQDGANQAGHPQAAHRALQCPPRCSPVQRAVRHCVPQAWAAIAERPGGRRPRSGAAARPWSHARRAA